MKDRLPPILPIAGERNVLITSALPYCNNAPHLGNIIGCVLSADVFARYCRLRGYNTLYICGTDEYGTTTEIKAMQENCTPQAICDKYHALHSEVYEWFDISFDQFGRTSNPQHARICHDIFNKLLDNDYLSEDTIQQHYCDHCEKFLADRLVVGTCPDQDCNGPAKGDECEKCNKCLNPTDLIDPKCSVCGSSSLRIRDTSHLFLELPLLQDKLAKYVESTSASWSWNAVQATDSLIHKEGLKHRCITRDLKWGVPVPHERFKDKVFYVWFDAPIGYVSITACYSPDHWEKWWKNRDNVELYQFMGKDNIKFHTVLFPSYLLGTGERWTMMKTVSVTEYLNYESGKFSKSKGIGVFGTDVKEIKEIPVEVWRYYLLANRPEVSDTMFSWSDLEAKLSSELCNNLGNFINRVLSFLAKPRGDKDGGGGYSSIVPDIDPGEAESHLLTKKLGGEVGRLVGEYVDAMEKVKLKQGLKIAMAISSEGNAYLQGTHIWNKKDQQQQACRPIVMRTSAGLVYLLACLLEPFMPSFTVEVLKQLDLVSDSTSLLCIDKKGSGVLDKASRPWEIIPSGHRIGVPKLLFKKLKEDDVKKWQSKYAGTQADREAREEAAKATDQLKKKKKKEKEKKKL